MNRTFDVVLTESYCICVTNSIITKLPLALLLFLSFVLLNISLPCFSVHSNPTPILNLYSSRVLCDINLLVWNSVHQSPYCNYSPFFNSFYLPFLSILTLCPIHLTLWPLYIYLYRHFQLVSLLPHYFLFCKSHLDFLLGQISSSLLSFQICSCISSSTQISNPYVPTTLILLL